MRGIRGGKRAGGFQPAVGAQGGGIERERGVSADGVEGERRSGGLRAFRDQIENLGHAGGFFFIEKHRFGSIQDQVHHRADFLAEKLHCVAAGAGVGLPVDVARVIARRVGAVVLEIHRRAGAAAGELAGLAAPDAGAQRQAHPACGGQGARVGLLQHGEVHGAVDFANSDSASSMISR